MTNQNLFQEIKLTKQYDIEIFNQNKQSHIIKEWNKISINQIENFVQIMIDNRIQEF